MNENLQTIFGLLGGLAMFLFGMNMMSESLQKAAGEKMRTVLGAMTKNPLLGVISGALVTAVLQSSSATTVMAIGFVSAGLMTLPQAITIIFGANIGTTITAQIIAFKLSDYIFIIIFAGFILSVLAKKQRVKYIGETIFAFGLLFEGIQVMGDVMTPLAESPVFLHMISKVADAPLLGVLTGTLMTLVVQSSSATIAVLQNFASQAGPDGVTSILGLAGAIPILLGNNIGTTITAILASIGQSKDAKRTAAAHCIFNISGAILFLPLLKPFTAFVQWISPKEAEVEVISRQIANAHTTFNIVMTLIWTPLTFLMVKIVMKMIPDRAQEELSLDKPKYLDTQLLSQAEPALHLAHREVFHVAHIVSDMLSKAELLKRKNNEDIAAEITREADAVVSLDAQINDYFHAMISDGTLTEEQAEKASKFLLMENDLLKISDEIKRIAYNILDSDVADKGSSKSMYSKKAMRDVRDSLHLVHTTFDELLRGAISGENGEISEKENAELLLENRAQLLNLHKVLEKNHAKRVESGKCLPEMEDSFRWLAYDFDRLSAATIDLVDRASALDQFRELLRNEPRPGMQSLAMAAPSSLQDKKSSRNDAEDIVTILEDSPEDGDGGTRRLDEKISEAEKQKKSDTKEKNTDKKK